MGQIADLLFQARLLKDIPRSGFHFLGAGNESVAAHSFSTAFIAFVLGQTVPDIDGCRLISMCLVHDLNESRIGDLNTVHKEYVAADAEKALMDTVAELPFEGALEDLIREFEANKTPEAKLARDADQLALIIDLKALADIGYDPPRKWLPPIIGRLQTDAARVLAADILKTSYDNWWLKKMG
jgi:putative hydrolase of HD superfamily